MVVCRTKKCRFAYLQWFSYPHQQVVSVESQKNFPRFGTYHSRLAEGVPPPLVHRRALAGVPVTEAAASDHHVVEGVVVFVLGVPALPQQSVAQSEETREVDANICHSDQI